LDLTAKIKIPVHLTAENQKLGGGADRGQLIQKTSLS